MSFAKAQDLLRLARMAATRQTGVSLADIAEEFGVSHRTAQRMTEALEAVFDNVACHDGPDRRRRWRVVDPLMAVPSLRFESVLEALEIAERTAREERRLRHARALEELRDRLLARLPPQAAARSQADAEAVLMAMGQVARPGPRVMIAPELLDAIIEALRGPFRMRIRYGQPDAPVRVIEPHGLLSGHRSYLVARQPDRDERMRNFRLDRIRAFDVLEESFTFQPGFTIRDYAARAFGVWQDPGQFGEVVWRFAPDAAPRAAEFEFHPGQRTERRPDGSLIVRFSASGWLEMAWHLYQWGDRVEVISPPGLRDLVEGYRRADFVALP
ncbi:MAG: WYL domain-containing protein [Alphaproteobacteria bacterium]|nr:MAG: WYL domain-containing protein [Alphaproteobacteria bacterium]